MLTIKPKVWIEKERLNGKIVDCTTIILKTRGCRWNACYMCGYTHDSYPASKEELIDQINYALKVKTPVVKIFTSGSFFDELEIPREVRDYIRRKIAKIGVDKLIVESRPEFIQDDILSEFEGLHLEVGIGLETANDKIRDLCVNKGFSFSEFERAAKKLREWGFRVKCYLLLKPPFLSENEAIEDVFKSIEKVKDLVDVVSLNLTNIQKGTLVERLWFSKLYRPPWLWSAVYILNNVEEVDIICDPVAAGKERGPHNCGKCDEMFAKAIRMYSLTQDKNMLRVSCECKVRWKKALELEDISRIPLFRSV